MKFIQLIKNNLKRIFPSKALNSLRNIISIYKLASDNFYDFYNYIKHSSTLRVDNEEKAIGKLILYYHVLEKGLSFENSRYGFGQEVAGMLVNSLNDYIKLGYDQSNLQFRAACSTLIKYFDKNGEASDYLKNLKDQLNPTIHDMYNPNFGGSLILKKEDISKYTNINYKDFYESRHSIREFSEVPVEKSKILEALNISQKYPSVCNRQAGRVYLISSKSKVIQHLNYQNGNRGFTDKVDKLIIVTVDLMMFSESQERNQPYIDGGIYLMSILLALHSVGLGAVPLNWSVDRKADKYFRSHGTIKENELIISFIGIGNLKDEMVVPRSQRSLSTEVLTEIE